MTLYKTLKKGEFRLLRLQPAESLDAPLHIQIFQVSLDSDLPEYEALTYVWGDSWGDFPVWIDSDNEERVSLDLTVNLDAALRHIRYRDRCRVLWVDAICINQHDLAERSLQVQQMRHIYENCTADIAWLGPTPFPPPKVFTIDDVSDDDGDTEKEDKQDRLARKNKNHADRRAYREKKHKANLREGLTLMRRVAGHDSATLTDMVQHHHYATTWQPKADAKDTEAERLALKYDPDDSNAKHPPLLTYEQSLALRTTFSATRLWQRVWIVQELSCAPKVILTVGIEDANDLGDRLSTLNWDEELIGGFLDDKAYADAFHSSWGHGTIGPAAARIFARVRSLHLQRKYTRSQSLSFGNKEPKEIESNEKVPDKVYRSFLDILARFKWASSTDPRDKVYGLLGLVTEETPFLPPVDYAKSPAEVYTDTTLAIIHASGSLDLISQNPFYGSGVFGDDHSYVQYDDDGYSSDIDRNDEKKGERVHNLPSWVPNFDHSQHWEYDDQFATILFAQRGIYAAGRSDCRHLFPLQTISGAATMDGTGQRPVTGIKLRGTVIGHMAAFRQGRWADEARVHNDGRSPLNTLIKMRATYVDDPSREYKATGEKWEDAFWRTMVADCEAYPIQRLNWTDVGAACGQALAAACAKRAEEQAKEDADTKDLTTDKEWQDYRHSAEYEHWPASADMLQDTAVCQMLLRMMARWGMCEVVSSVEAEETTESSLLSMVWPGVQQGDVVAVLDGSKVPVVLRPQDILVECPGDGDTFVYYKFVSPAYVHGYMDGKALEQLGSGLLTEQDFVLI